MIVAGETSGDTHAAKLVNAIREAEPGSEPIFFGCAGPEMRRAGVEPVVEADHLSVVGLLEIAASLPMFLSAFRKLKRAAVSRKPNAVILVDFPEFNLKLAQSLRRTGIPIVYYISPQLWAWRKYRLAGVQKNIDLMLTIMPFEQPWYQQNGFDRVKYVGSPLAREIHPAKGREEFRRQNGIRPDDRLIALLPGSREREITRILPVMSEAVSEITRKRPDTRFIIGAANDRHLETIRHVIANRSDLPVIAGETHDLLFASDAAAVTSGTATLEAGILGTPMVVVYKTSALNYKLFEPMIDVPHYGLINLIAGNRLAKELIQHEFTPASLADELMRLLQPETNLSMKRQLLTATESLGHGGTSRRAAEAILELMEARTS
jgi:lipid-A-disaccharide synthase